MAIKILSSDKNFIAIVNNAIALSEMKANEVEIARLPSGKTGFIYLAVEDVLGDLAGSMTFDGETFKYEGDPIGDEYVGLLAGSFLNDCQV